MQIIESSFFTTIIPDKGYKIVNKNNGKFYKKVLLGPNDSVDNYGEVVDEKYISIDYIVELDKLKSTIEENELTIDLLLYSIDEMYTSVEPLLAMVPMTIETENKEGCSNSYVSDVLPCRIRSQVFECTDNVRTRASTDGKFCQHDGQSHH